MLGADVRFQSIYVEHVDAGSLQSLRLASNAFSRTKSDSFHALANGLTGIAAISYWRALVQPNASLWSGNATQQSGLES